MLYLGIDGGGSGCRAAVADEAGRVLGRGAGGPANIASDLEGARENLLRAARAALADAGLPESEMPRLRAGLGLAGANGRGFAERLRAALPFAEARIVSDAVAAVKGALGERDGIVAALGTGSVFARQRGGAVRLIGGWGLILGDEASGAWIGRAILSQALRAVDGFVPQTPLLAALVAEQGGPDGVVNLSLAARPADFAAFAPRVVASDDPAAREVMDRAVAEVAAAVDLLQEGAALPVVLLGGLGPVFAARLGGRWAVIPALGTALDGALLLARGG
ncbi:BadF/BadG/BcrA/BcrD ATPase family protein [Rubellimicrobium aerolatum]|uniref:BadF/BadG/BcrA/BcrD ATPase family protein n=1 Tax=Rubellimicrobium aerolatum TaxID=490979 RepID=A0ABW0S7X7_9RHOB|nr:BadF/BadG/BcrA/BcrD ATPase family protein [Rubellimicrobium aerolatum]MBP1804439.1 glucosamine kinase [Rubellimicrobium aerolatum]